MSSVVTAPLATTLAVVGKADVFPVNRVFCVGRNYAAHAREMGKDPNREPPFFFMKPANAVIQAGETETTIPYPPMTRDFHHEIELVLAIGEGGANIAIEHALEHVFGYAIGLDMTRRDLQLEARNKGRPWEFGKSFRHSAPIGPIFPASETNSIEQANIQLSVNGVLRQSSNLAELIWSVRECIAHLSMYESLEPGDLIMTGTPEGVGPVMRGDLMEGAIDGLGRIAVNVAA